MRYNWHIRLYEFQVYSLMTGYFSTFRNLINIHHHRYQLQNIIFSCRENFSDLPSEQSSNTQWDVINCAVSRPHCDARGLCAFIPTALWPASHNHPTDGHLGGVLYLNEEDSFYPELMRHVPLFFQHLQSVPLHIKACNPPRLYF